MGWAATTSPVVGLLSCSGSCRDATLSKRAAIRAMGDYPDKFIDIWLTAPSLGLAYANKIAVGASLEDFKKSFESIIAVEGCKTACATQLLTSMGLTPASTVFLSEIFREDEIIGVSSAEDDREIEMRVPEIIEELIKLSSKE